MPGSKVFLCLVLAFLILQGAAARALSKSALQTEKEREAGGGSFPQSSSCRPYHRCIRPPASNSLQGDHKNDAGGRGGYSGHSSAVNP